MNIHVKPPSKSDRIRAVMEANPTFGNAEIAKAAGVTDTYVRAIRHRERHNSPSGRLEAALSIAQRTYAEALRLRRESEIKGRDQDTYARYCRAWDLHKAAEQVYVGLDREDSRPADRMPRGVPVREIMARQGHLVRVAGKVG